jgi:hypothetical protein
MPLDKDRLQFIEFFNQTTAAEEIKLKVAGCLLGVFDTQAEAQSFANSTAGGTLIARARKLAASPD